MLARILIAIAVGLMTGVAVTWLRHYPLSLALLSGVMVAGLAFATVHTVARLRQTLAQFRRPQ